MKVIQEINLFDFQFWAGAKGLAQKLLYEEFETIERELEDYLEQIDEIWDDTQINDFFWFEDDTIAEWLGYEDEDQMWSDMLSR